MGQIKVKKTRTGRYHVYFKGSKVITLRSKKAVTEYIEQKGLNHA